MKLYIGNKAYSSWSLRGWLACKQSGLPFEEDVAPLYNAEWDQRRLTPDFAPSGGKVPILYDGEAVVWDSLAIVDYLNDKTGGTRFWPSDQTARAMARSLAAEMHAGFAALRNEHGMNLRRTFSARAPSTAVAADIARIMALWSGARDTFGAGGPFLFGAFGAADIMFAPVCTRFRTYELPIEPFAEDYVAAVLDHPFMREWTADALAEPWVIDKFEQSEPA